MRTWPHLMRPGQSFCWLLVLSQLHKTQVPAQCTGIPVLVHWAVIAVLCRAAIGFALCVMIGLLDTWYTSVPHRDQWDNLYNERM